MTHKRPKVFSRVVKNDLHLKYAIFFIFSCSCSHLRENTISSLKNAYSHGADMVEFDVQLSKDKIPVIYHDYELCTTSMSKDGQQGELIPTQLKNLTLKQLRGLKINHVNAIDSGVKVQSCSIFIYFELWNWVHYHFL